jgi:solute carrier family 6 GABA transporter-like protein 1
VTSRDPSIVLPAGAFLVTYTIAMVFCGVPIFFQEVAIGQYLGSGGMNLVGQLCPILQGGC